MYLSKYCDDILTDRGERYLLQTLAGRIDPVTPEIYEDYKRLKRNGEETVPEETKRFLMKGSTCWKTRGRKKRWWNRRMKAIWKK